MKSRAYMKGSEFKARQGWLPFVDAVGIVLKVLEPVKEAAWEWFKAWKKNFRTVPAPFKKPKQLDLFHWATLTNRPLFAESFKTV